ncbi:HdeD family acid-resistance protein [Thermodesulfobacteriota bacterium]
MAANNEITTDSIEASVFGEVKRNWGWLLALGIMSLILGIIGLGMTFVLTLASMMFFGILLIVGGGAQIVEAFKCKGWKGILLHILIAVIYLFAGIVVINNPVGASMILTLMFAGALVAVGLLRIVMAIQLRGFSNWIWPLLGGILSILLGAMIVGEWPVSGLWVIGLFIALELIIHGWSYIFVALAARNAEEPESLTEEAAEPVKA